MAKAIRKPDYGTLSFLYLKKDYTMTSLATNFEVSKSTVYRWLKSYGIRKERREIFIVALVKIFLRKVFECFQQMIKIFKNLS